MSSFKGSKSQALERLELKQSTEWFQSKHFSKDESLDAVLTGMYLWVNCSRFNVMLCTAHKTGVHTFPARCII